MNPASLSPWRPSATPLPNSFCRVNSSIPTIPMVFVVPAGPTAGWKVVFPHGTNHPVESMGFPDEKSACAYADAALLEMGIQGPGIQPLPEEYPSPRKRNWTHIPCPSGNGALQQVGVCECGHVGMDIYDFNDPCTACGGLHIVSAWSVAKAMGTLAQSQPG